MTFSDSEFCLLLFSDRLTFSNFLFLSNHKVLKSRNLSPFTSLHLLLFWHIQMPHGVMLNVCAREGGRQGGKQDGCLWGELGLADLYHPPSLFFSYFFSIPPKSKISWKHLIELINKVLLKDFKISTKDK